MYRLGVNKMQINYKLNGQFEHLYPVTLGDNVRLNNGTTLEEWKKEVEDSTNVVEDNIKTLQEKVGLQPSNYKELWRGDDLIGASSNIKPSKKISDCNNGWLLVFRNASALNNFSYHYIPKIQILFTTTEGVKILAGSSNGVIAQKYVIIQDEAIKGISNNETGDNAKATLTRVYEF